MRDKNLIFIQVPVLEMPNNPQNFQNYPGHIQEIHWVSNIVTLETPIIELIDLHQNWNNTGIT